MPRLSRILLVRTSGWLLLNPFDMSHHSLTNFFIFWHKVFWEHLVFSMFQPSNNQPFSQGALVPFSGKWYLEIKIWVIGVLKLLLGWETASRLFQWAELWNGHTFIFIYVYIKSS